MPESPPAASAPPTRPPRWAVTIDFSCLVIAVAAVIIAMSGGFRLHIGSWRIALTSPYRLLVWAVVLGVVRHLGAPEVPVYRDLPRRLAAWWRTAAVRAALPVLVGTRPAIYFVGYVAVFTIGYAQGRAPIRAFENEAGNLPLRWDAGWYLDIVQAGYSFEPNDPDRQQNIVFFPAYPILVRAAGRLLGGAPPGYVIGGVAVSLVAFFVGLIYLYALARDRLEPDQARCALWLLAAYPFAVFFGAIYTEALFLAAAAGAFYHFTKRQFWRAAAWGAVAGLTRPNGFLLAVPLGVIAVSPWLPPLLVRAQPRRAARAAEPRDRHLLIQSVAAAAAPVVGMAMYAAYVWWRTGDPLAWAAGHVAWGRTYRGLTTLVTERYDFIAQAGLYGYTAELPHDLLNALGVVFVLATAWPVARRFGLAYAVFIVINILPPLAAGGLLSAGRFSSVLFPAFLWLAAVVPRHHRAGWIATFAALQALSAVLFYTWRPLY